MSTASSGGFASFLAARDYDPAALAHALGVPSATLYGWKSGRCSPPVTQTRTLEGVASFFEVPLSAILAHYPPYEAVQALWSRSHGQLLEGMLTDAGYTASTVAEHVSTSHASISRWIRGRTRPRPQQLEPLLTFLEVSPLEFLEVEPSLPPVENEFATRLRALVVETGLSQRKFAEYLGVSQGNVNAWLQGRTFPAGDTRVVLEQLLGTTIVEAKENVELARISLEGRAGLALYLTELRKERRIGLKRAAALIGVSVKTLSSWESGKAEPSKVALRKVAAVYDVPVREIAEILHGPLERVPGETFGERLKRLRRARLMGLVETAEATGMRPHCLYRYEDKGHFPGYRLGRLPALADVFEVSLVELLGFDENDGRFAAWLNSQVEAAGLTLEDVALVTGEDDDEVESWSAGTSLPGLNLVSPLAGLFKVTFDEVRSQIII